MRSFDQSSKLLSKPETGRHLSNPLEEQCSKVLGCHLYYFNKKVVSRIEFLDTCFYIPDVNIKNSRL
jgi:hypothetical protein